MGQQPREFLQRRKQDIGEGEFKRRAPANGGRGNAVGAADANYPGGAVKPRIVPRDAHGIGVDIGCKDRPAQRTRGRDRKDAAAGAEIEDVPRC